MQADLRKKVKIINPICSILLLVLFVGCSMKNEIDLDINYYRPLIVVNGNISWENGVHVTVKKTVSLLNENETDSLQNPKVWLADSESNLIELTKKNSYEFELNDIDQLSETMKYRVVVEADGFERVCSAFCTKIQKMMLEDVAYNNIDGYISYTIVDFSEERNYYRMTFWDYRDGIKGDNRSGIDIYPVDVVQDSNFENGKLNGIYSNISSRDDSLNVVIYSLDKHFYEFAESYDVYALTYAQDYSDDAYPIFSNIEGGVGCFYSYEQHVVNVKISEK